MDNPKRWALHAACRIRQSLANMHGGRPSVSLPETAWSQCARLIRQIDKAAGRDWTLTARRLHGELVGAIGTCRRHLEQVAWELDGDDTHPRLPTQRELFGDLIALEDEFDEVPAPPPGTCRHGVCLIREPRPHAKTLRRKVGRNSPWRLADFA